MIDRENDRKKAEGKKIAGSPPKRYPPSPIIALSAVVSVKSLWHQKAERLMLLFIFLPRRRGLCGTTGAVAIFTVETLSARNGRNGLGMHRVASSSFLQELKQVSLNSLYWHHNWIKTLWYDIKTMFTHSPKNILRLFLNKIKLNRVIKAKPLYLELNYYPRIEGFKILVWFLKKKWLGLQNYTKLVPHNNHIHWSNCFLKQLSCLLFDCLLYLLTIWFIWLK